MYPAMLSFGAKMSAIRRGLWLRALFLFGYDGDLAALRLTRSTECSSYPLNEHPAWFSVTLGAGASKLPLGAEISMISWAVSFHFFVPREGVVGFLVPGFGRSAGHDWSPLNCG